MIREAGFIPAKRDNRYDILTIHDGADSPDRLVTDWSLSNNEQLVSHTEECSTVTLTVDQ